MFLCIFCFKYCFCWYVTGNFHDRQYFIWNGYSDHYGAKHRNLRNGDPVKYRVNKNAKSCPMEMADISKSSVNEAIKNIFNHSVKSDEHIADIENMVDKYEDRLGSYLLRFSGREISVNDSRTVSKILHTIGDFERISDHALNLTESAREISEKRIVMSESTVDELKKLREAVEEIVQT